jgi:uncharacterized membrane protein YdbT with pleckstrin-like domain
MADIELGAEASKVLRQGGPEEEVVFFQGRPAVLPSLGSLLLVVLTLGLWLIPCWLRSLGCNYKLTSRRVVVETGVFSKQLEQVDLYRINDYTVVRPFFQRVMGTGTLVLRTMDKSTPDVRVSAIKTDVVALYEQLRAATEADKLRRGARVVDYE